MLRRGSGLRRRNCWRRYHRLSQLVVHIVISLKPAAMLLQQRDQEHGSLQGRLELLSGVPSRHCQYMSTLRRGIGIVTI